MKSNYTKQIYKYVYFMFFFGYLFFILSSLLISLIESFSYDGFFYNNFSINNSFIFISAVISGFYVSVFPVETSLKESKWIDLIKQSFLLNINLLIFLILFTLSVNFLEGITYNNFIYSTAHLQPQLLYRVVLLQAISVFVNLFLIIREGADKEKLITINKLGIIKLDKVKNISISNIQEAILSLFAITIVVWGTVNSFNFTIKFYEQDQAFLKSFEIDYAFGRVSINEWIDNFFPKTKSVVHWCNKQPTPVKLVTFDPLILWMDYEGLSRVFLTNCYYDSILSISEIYSNIGKKDIYLVSVATCDESLEKIEADPKADKMEYLELINNKYICNSSEIVSGLYYYK